MNSNRLLNRDRAIHDWYRFVLAYPPHLVREYLAKLDADPDRDWVYDPFSGTATTPLEARLNGFRVAATDANPVAVLANRVKLNWEIDLDALRRKLEIVLQVAADALRAEEMLPILEPVSQLSLFADALPDIPVHLRIATPDAAPFEPEAVLSEEARKLIPTGYISDLPLVRVLAIRHAIESVWMSGEMKEFLRLALATTTVSAAGNIAFGPEVYATAPKLDADVLTHFRQTALRMIGDAEELIQTSPAYRPSFHVSRDDARLLSSLENHPLIGIVITSPPYPNEKDYTRTTRLENVLLGYLRSKADLRELKEMLLRSNTRNVFSKDDDDRYVADIAAIQNVAAEIEQKRIDLSKTSGFERLYHRVVTLYFGGMYRHLASLLPHLRPGARCAYVVGDQQSFFRVHIPTAHLLADVALKAGYEVEGIETWRNRFATATKKHIDENTLILRKPE